MSSMRRFWRVVGIVGILAGCASTPLPPDLPSGPGPSVSAPADDVPLGAAIVQGKSRWVPVRWGELPGFEDDALHEAWNAWLRSCERPPAA